ncbi:hypothetical protein ACH5RR_007167 [Cinchona calisaya]|uniref:Reverse transcriptase domain-containing protein n=1 Tax=Cinchona calisaya TaxID=153742 RepID=A0ABD3ARE9_9GENT
MLQILRKSISRAATIPRFPILFSFPSSSRFLFSSEPIKPLTKPDLNSLILSHYHHGKFHGLLQNVVASPSVLLTACQNLKTPATSNSPLTLLLDSSVSSHFFSLQELSSQLYTNGFDVDSCCFTLPPSSHKGKSLVLPNLKLKVVIEAIRMVLEFVYDDRFVTFSYGGRLNMGRHTAIRYLKNSVENPSWWFTVSFNGDEKFDAKHVDRLCLIIGEKIKDEALIGMIKRLFESNVVRIEFGGCYLGRGFPQECGLSSILINIYFNSFDKEIQELRLKTNKDNPKFEVNELVGGLENSVQYKPLKIYAVRYLDEILLITSGTKMLTMDLKAQLVKYLEEHLELKVDRGKTVIHSAVSEKIYFLGMELQAVTPSVLHPAPSQKAIRAWKKYLRQKEVRLLELRNAKETNRKKLGMKIMSHVFKKLKRSDGFKFEFQIENEVNQIFRTWADEVVQEYLKSVDERWEWHRMLSAGDFLSLKRIRDQLPQELVDAYDNFQEQVDKYLKPVKAKKALEEEERRAEEEEEQKYTERTVKDLTTLRIKVDAPIEQIRKAVKMIGFTNHMGRPRPISLLMVLEDTDIIKWYAGIGRRWLDFFCCCHNFKMVKTVVTYHLRFSCILTLAEKHESTKREAIRHYTKDLKVFDLDGAEEFHFPTERKVKMMGDKNLSDPWPVDGPLTTALTRLATDESSYCCVAHFCDRKDTIVYRIRLLENLPNEKALDENKWVPGIGSIHESLNRKCIPLCSDHISELYMGRLTLQDIDCTSFSYVLLLRTHHVKKLHNFHHLKTIPLPSTFDSCKDLNTLRKTHSSLIVSNGIPHDESHFEIARKLLSLYTKFDDFDSSFAILKSMKKPDTFLWNSSLKALVNSGLEESAFWVYKQMREIGVEHDSYTFPIINQGVLLSGEAFWFGKMIHGLAVQMGFGNDVYFCNTMIEVYVKSGCSGDAWKLFVEMPDRDFVSWTTMISAYVSEGNSSGAFGLFGEMRNVVEPNAVTMLVLLQACSSVIEGRQLHGYMTKRGFLLDLSVQNSMLDMFIRVGSVSDAEIFFGEMDKRDVVSWNIMLSLYSLKGEIMRMVDCFREMSDEVEHSCETLTVFVSGLTEGRNLGEGRQIHCLALKKGLCDDKLRTSLLGFYARHGEVEMSAELFGEVCYANSITWNTMMLGFIENGLYKECIALFKKMLVARVQLAAENLTTLIVAYTHMGAIQLGKGVHGYIIRNSFLVSGDATTALETSILNMYLRCGSLSVARVIFDRMVTKDLVAWTMIIEGYGTYGLGLQALQLFQQMVEEGVKPNSVTFLSLLSACSHSGLLSEGCKILYTMRWKFEIEPNLNHYTCIVDMLGRRGMISEALAVVIKVVPFPDGRIWGALLAASRVYMDRKIGVYAADRLLELEPENAGYYTLLSNIQASAESWAAVEEVRSTIKLKDLMKPPGWSCIEAKGLLRGFVSGDRSHPYTSDIHETLGYLNRTMQDIGYKHAPLIRCL